MIVSKGWICWPSDEDSLSIAATYVHGTIVCGIFFGNGSRRSSKMEDTKGQWGGRKLSVGFLGENLKHEKHCMGFVVAAV